MADIITLGELLIDLTQTGTDELGNGKFTAYPGGAPANVAVAASRLGADTAFIGKVGNDAFGRFLRETLEKDKVDTVGLEESDEHPTTMAIVSVDDSGEREFTFYRDPGADTQLTEDEAVASIDAFFYEAIEKDDPADIELEDIKELGPDEAPLIVHVGSLSMTTEPSKTACEEAVRFAKERDMLVSYDPNYREALWSSREQAVEMMKKLLSYADILKVSDEEMEMLTGTSDFKEGSRILCEMGRSEYKADGEGITLVMVTLGADGVFVRCGDTAQAVPGFKVSVADTNGAGDTFLGAMLAQISERLRYNTATEKDDTDLTVQLRKIMDANLVHMVTYANKAASLTCSRSGAIPAMPTAAELK